MVTFPGQYLSGDVVVSWLPDGTKLAVGDGPLIRVFDTPPNLQCTQSSFIRSRVNTITFSNDGSKLATGSANGNAAIWATSSGDLHCVLKEHSRPIKVLCWSLNDKIVAAADYWKHNIIIWDALAGRSLHVLQSIGAVLGLSFLAQDLKLASFCFRLRSIDIWDVSSGQLLHTSTIQEAPQYCSSEAFSHDRSKAIGGATNGNCFIWDIMSGELISEHPSPYLLMRAVAWGVDDSVVVELPTLASTARSLRWSAEGAEWEKLSPTELAVLMGWEFDETSPISCRLDLRNERDVYATSQSGLEKMICRLPPSHKASLDIIAWRGSYIACGCQDGEVIILKVRCSMR